MGPFLTGLLIAFTLHGKAPAANLRGIGNYHEGLGVIMINYGFHLGHLSEAHHREQNITACPGHSATAVDVCYPTMNPGHYFIANFTGFW